ncbi:MAG: histidine phosphatase family protein [Anaerolineaceae bacterium]|nr:histidine phosphatase family protein [Anaerolineaceae bacterium]
MKTVLLMRHAKSSWKDHKLKDFDRPLAKRGKKDVPTMGQLLAEKELVPQMILSSPALRARLTAEIVAEKCGYKGEITYLDSFYLAEPAVYAGALCALPDEVERAMLIGHNPGIEGLLQIMSGVVESLPTSGIAYLVLPISHWAELEGAHAEICEMWHPRQKKDKK